MFTIVKKSDTDLERDVMNELNWDPSITSTGVDVRAKNAVVTLRGSVPHYSEKRLAEKVVQRVGGVRVVANELEVSLLDSKTRSDESISANIVAAIEWNYQIPPSVKVSVDKGWVFLRGEVEWDYQRIAAVEAVAKLMGVRGVSNDIVIKEGAQASDIKLLIQNALKRTVEKEGVGIKVEVNGHRVILSGEVHSLTELEEARIAAYNAPGIILVENNLKVAA